MMAVFHEMKLPSGAIDMFFGADLNDPAERRSIAEVYAKSAEAPSTADIDREAYRQAAAEFLK